MPVRIASSLVVLSLASVTTGCAAPNVPPSPRAASALKEPASGMPARPANELLFTGMCDASGAVALSDRLVLVADDEDNVLRVYDVERGGSPTAQLDLSELLGLPRKEKKDGTLAAPPEVDIEAAARIADRAYFITSHGRNSSGKLRSERLRFFATSAPAHGALALIGEAYGGLLKDFLTEPRLAPFELEAASLLAPKAEGGLNIEGLTARAQGGLWLGFRNPIPKGRALLLPLLNPDELVTGKPAKLGDPITLDLGGRGVRGLSSWHGRYLIAAGSFDSTSTAALFTWDGGDQVTAVSVPDLGRYNPEALFTPEGRDDVLLLSDDGSVPLDGVECKSLKDASEKHFRGLWFRPQ
jgi:hypothetical protein